MDPILAIDFGSTYTKALLFDRGSADVVGVAHVPSTVGTDITVGLRRVLDLLHESTGVQLRGVPSLACSSAAGGLRIAVIGLVPALSMEAARRAALGAGGKVVGAYGYKLSRRAMDELVVLAPDIVLLCGGTDGGDEETILHNATALGRANLAAPVIVAGNEFVVEECAQTLQSAGKTAYQAHNLLPEVGRIEVRAVHDLIRDVFIRHITHAKGIDRVREHLELIADIIPTPSAVLTAARLIADGTGDMRGLGETVVIDVGGATTDVHSVSSGAPTRPGVVVRGLPELRAKRTVEGDLGMRINAPTIVERYGPDRLLALAAIAGALTPLTEADIVEYAGRVATRTAHIPGTDRERLMDHVLGRAAVALAIRRHAGTVRDVFTTTGTVPVQEGKDLGEVAVVVGVGGVLAHGGNARFVLEGVIGAGSDPQSLMPRRPALYLDQQYILYGIGLLSDVAPEAALASARRLLTPL